MSEYKWYLDDFQRHSALGCILSGKNAKGEDVIFRGFTDGSDTPLDITNDFAPAGANDIISGLRDRYEANRGSLARRSAMAASLTDMLGNITGFEELNDLGNWINDNVGSIASKQIEIADDYLYLFKGTRIEVPTNFNMILISDGTNDIYTDRGGWYDIIDTFVGDFNPLSAGGQSFLGIQDAPAGYQADLYAFNPVPSDSLTGIFDLRLGNQFVYSGYVVAGLSHTISKVNTFARDGSSKRPLFIQIRVTLQMIRKMTKNSIMDNMRLKR